MSVASVPAATNSVSKKLAYNGSSIGGRTWANTKRNKENEQNKFKLLERWIKQN
jgi:hypothetical protein